MAGAGTLTVREIITALGFDFDERALTRADKRVAKFGQRAEKVATNVRSQGMRIVGTLGTLAAGLGATFGISEILRVNVAFDRLEQQLVSLTGSVERGKEAFDFVRGFAIDTPFQVENLTAAFVALKGAGLEPTRETMQGLSNFAAAMGKDIFETAEAVRAASTGEFERLKQLNVVARVEGNKLVMLFNGVRTKIDRDAESVRKYLVDIGNTQFAGAAAARMGTLEGAVSNLKDQADELFQALGKGGLSGAIMEIATSIKEWIAEQDGARESGAKLGKAILTAFKVTTKLLSAVDAIADEFGGWEKMILAVVAAFAGWRIGALITSVGSLSGALTGAAAATRAVGAAAAANPFGAIAAGLAIVIPLAIKLGDELGDMMADLAGLNAYRRDVTKKRGAPLKFGDLTAEERARMKALEKARDVAGQRRREARRAGIDTAADEFESQRRARIEDITLLWQSAERRRADERAKARAKAAAEAAKKARKGKGKKKKKEESQAEKDLKILELLSKATFDSGARQQLAQLGALGKKTPVITFAVQNNAFEIDLDVAVKSNVEGGMIEDPKELARLVNDKVGETFKIKVREAMEAVTTRIRR